jgi:hypothetical protein
VSNASDKGSDHHDDEVQPLQWRGAAMTIYGYGYHARRATKQRLRNGELCALKQINQHRGRIEIIDPEGLKYAACLRCHHCLSNRVLRYPTT